MLCLLWLYFHFGLPVRRVEDIEYSTESQNLYDEVKLETVMNNFVIWTAAFISIDMDIDN